MTDKQPLGELLLQALDDIDEVGGPERHQLVQGDRARRLRGAHRQAKGCGSGQPLVRRYRQSQGAATKALAIGISRGLPISPSWLPR